MNFNAKLLKVSDTVKTNVNGTKYRPVTIEFVTKDGEVKTANTIMYEANFEFGVEVGKTYIATVEKDELGNVYSHVSHLLVADRIEADDFDFEGVEAVAAEKAALAEVNG